MYKKNKHRTYLDDYVTIILTQSLAKSRWIKQRYDKTSKGKWFLTYESNCVSHICPYSGIFKNCSSCGAAADDFDTAYCTKFYQYVDNKELSARIRDCKRAGLEIQYVQS